MADAESNLVPSEAADQVEVALEEQAAADDDMLYLNEYQYENDLVTDFARLVASPRRRGSLYVAAAIAALIGIDNSYFEAAELDGATFFQKVRYIVWPLVKPTTLFLLVTGVIGSFQVFMNAYMMTGGGPDNATTMIGLLIYNNAFVYGKYGLACAQAILLAITIAIMSLFQFRLMGVDVEY